MQPSAFGQASAFGPPPTQASVPPPASAPVTQAHTDVFDDQRIESQALPDDVRACFEADHFVWGHIPAVEPPVAFCT